MKKSLLIFYVLFSAHLLISQQVPKFKRYTKNDGLVSNYVYCIAQDTKGFIWFGTKNGVSRFDGYEFKNYLGDEGPGTYGKGWTKSIITDRKGRLWFGSMTPGSKSLLRYDYHNDKFIDFEPFLSTKNSNVNCLLCDQKGRIWVGTTRLGVFMFHPDSSEITQYKNNQNDENSLLKGEINCFAEDKAGHIWIGTTSGLNKYNINTGTFTSFIYSPQDPSGLSNQIIEAIYIDSENDIWLGIKDGGLNRLVNDSSKEGATKFERIMHVPGEGASLSHNSVYSICEDSHGKLFVATLYGLNIFDKKSGRFQRCHTVEENTETINSNLVRSIFKDRTGNMCIGTGMGVARSLSSNFRTYMHSKYQQSISHNKVEMLHQDKTGDVWIATPKGFDVYNPLKNQFNSALECNNKYPCWFTSNTDKCWLISPNAELLTYDCLSKVIKPFWHHKADSLSLDISEYLIIHIDNMGNTWIGKRSGGLYFFGNDNKTYYKFEHSKTDSFSLSNSRILAILEDSMGNIWIGTNSGLNKLLDFEKGQFQRIPFHSGNTDKTISVFCMTETSNNSFWLGTSSGIGYLGTKADKALLYDEDKGFPNSSLFGIIEDNSQNLWISSNSGLIKYIPDYSNLGTIGKVRVYTIEDGLPDEEFNLFSYLKLNDGSLIFGGNGFIHFHPDSIRDNPYAPQLVFTGLNISGKPVLIDDTINNQIVLHQSLLETEEIILNHKNVDFSVKFAALHYNAPGKNQYKYKLEGYHKDWQYIDATHRQVNFMNLKKGEYTLQVLASNSDGIWMEHPKELKIKILPPWWLTIWSEIFAIGIFILLIFLVIRFRTYNLRKQKLKLEKIVKQRTAELQGKNIELEEGKEELEQQAREMEEKSKEIERIANQLHEADQSKLRFFANISHEFRTPLALILGPLERFSNLKQPIVHDNLNVSNSLNLMHKNAKKLLRLVNEIIDLRKMDQGKKSLNLSQNNIVDFLQDIVKLFTVMAETKHIHLTLDIDKCKMINDFWFDPEILEKIFYNLISNAIKYTPEGGGILIAVAVETRHALSLQPQLAIKISDTGIGIEPENLNKIFDRFYRVETHGHASLQNNRASQPEGTGIGLAYTKELVELHNGTISVTSAPEKGTCFTLQFPFSNSNQSSQKKDESHIIKQENYNLDYINTRIKEEQSSDIYNQQQMSTQLSPSIDLPGLIPPKESVSDLKETVLIVEDTPDMRGFLREELQNFYTIILAKDGTEGVETAYQYMPDLIISDIMMPGISGIQLCTKLKSDETTSHIPIILLTAKTGEENALKGLETGADDYITKPFSINILKVKTHNILESRKKLRERFSKSINVIPEEYSKSSVDQKFLAKAIQIVEENLLDTEFNNDRFISLLGHGKTLVYKKLKSITNQSVSEFIRSIRLKKAAQLLLEGENNISQICFRVGFPNPSNFSMHFKTMFKKTPSQFIKDNQNLTD